MSLYEIFEAIRATSSKLEKSAILAAHKDNELLRKFLKAVYDPRITYGIKKLPKFKSEAALKDFGPEVLDDLMDLANRVYTGKAATQHLTNILSSLDEEGRELAGYVISHDVNAGMAENSVLGVWPDLFFIPPYQRCAKLDEKTKADFEGEDEFFVQTKSDGQFAYVANFGHEKFGDSDRFVMSRQGSLHPESVVNRVAYLVPRDMVAMGELLVWRSGEMLSRKDGNGILNSMLSGDGTKFNENTDSISFVAWDMVTKNEFEVGRSERPYWQRWGELSQVQSLEKTPCWTVKSVREAGIIQKDHLRRKLEGTVWKKKDMPWRDCSSGDPSQVKAKLVFEADFEIEGAYVHKKNPNMLGGFNVKTRDGLMRFDVGSGFSQQQRLDFWRILRENPKAFNGTVVALEGNDILTSKQKTTESVSLPIFIELRLDKTVADSRDDVWKEFNAAKQGKRAADLAD